MKIKRRAIIALLIVSALLLAACVNHNASEKIGNVDGFYEFGEDGAEDLSTTYYAFQDKASLLWGIYNRDTNQIVMEPIMREIGDFDSRGIAPAKKDGYWGYISGDGSTVIEFVFERADTFVGDYAVVYCEGSGAGVIDRNGLFIIDPQYDVISFKESFVLAEDSDGCFGYDYSGEMIVSEPYESIKEYNGLLYAEPYGVIGLYELYDCAGNKITGVGPWEDIQYVRYPENGVHILYYKESWQQDSGMKRIADEQLKFLNNEYYYSISTFNALGLAVAENQTIGWHILKADGSIVQNLPAYDIEVNYTDANEYVASCVVSAGPQNDKCYGTVILKTGELVIWGDVEPVAGTNYIIVTDEDTGLKGLYDKDSLVLSCVYQEISVYEEMQYNGVRFLLTQGETIEVYTPS